MRILDYLLGRQLSNMEDDDQKVGSLAGIPMLGLDALSSSAYGPEAALTVLLPLGAAGLNYLIPISAAIVILLTLVFVSYRQTIQAYPNGGGSYTVARENLGDFPGVLAAAALLLDYVLTVAVGIAAGVGALISAAPSLQPHTLLLCLLILLLLTLINLRGIKEAGVVFLFPTYGFLASIGTVLLIGAYKVLASHGAPEPVESIVHLHPSLTQSVGVWILLKAFASGCTAMTGVEAVSNGVRVFREPVVQSARRTLSFIVGILIALLGLIAWLCHAYQISATDPGQAGYESVISQLVRAVIGHGPFYYFTLGTVTVMLCLSANTAFADFPRLFQIIAKDGFLPESFAERGRRLVFSNGVFALSGFSGLLLIIFDGVTDRLIPLYAIGAFLAFTLSQLGMVFHWKKQKDQKIAFPLAINALGAIATGVTLVIVLISKFTDGGWISAIAVPVFVTVFFAIRHHYRHVASQTLTSEPLVFARVHDPIVVVPIRGWNLATRKAMKFAVEQSSIAYGVYVEREENNTEISDEDWQKFVAEPAAAAGWERPQLKRLPSPYRVLFGSFLAFIDELEELHPGRRISIIIPTIVVNKWYQVFLHNHRAIMLIATLYLRRDKRIVWSTVPWFLDP